MTAARRVSLIATPALVPALALALLLAPAGCQHKDAPRAVPTAPIPPIAPTSSAHPPEFVHPPIPPEPNREARPECSTSAMGLVAERIRAAQRQAAAAALQGAKRDRRSGCGSPALGELDRQVKGELADRVRICVGQDGPLDAEWNSVDSALSLLGVCLDCSRAVPNRFAECRQALTVVNSAEAAAQKKSPLPR